MNPLAFGAQFRYAHLVLGKLYSEFPYDAFVLEIEIEIDTVSKKLYSCVHAMKISR